MIKRVVLGLSILLGILGLFLIYAAWPLLTGKTIILATMPVDPFDLLRGQYMAINYEISNLPKISGAEAGDSIYVFLEPDKQGIFRMKNVSLEKPTTGVFIKAKLLNNGRAEYGIEQYFFEKGAQIPTTNITVEAKVSSSGRARIVQLLKNGKPVEIKYREKEYS